MLDTRSTKHLTIGELATKTGVACSALRYWEELGLIPAPARLAGQRRYPTSTVHLVGEILVLQDAGFTLREINAVLVSRADGSADWRGLHQRKLAELDDQIARAQAARTAIAHALKCPHPDTRSCPNAAAIIAARLDGKPLHEAHVH